MRIGLDFKSAQFDQVRGEAEDWIKMRDLKSSPVRIGGFEMTSHAKKSLLNKTLYGALTRWGYTTTHITVQCT
jgi:hypothetical protein